MPGVYCMHLKRMNHEVRKELIAYCMENSVLALGWSFLYDENPNPPILTMQDFTAAARAYYRKPKRPVETFSGLTLDDLVWTRDLDGNYYICRILERPVPMLNKALDIGAIVKADIRKVGLSVPGTIVHRFSTPRSPTIQRIANSGEQAYITAYSQRLYAQLSGNPLLTADNSISYDLFQLLSGFDLEELVIDYLQIKYDYYLSKNSVAKNDTTIKIECELYPRNSAVTSHSAVVQVKGGNRGTPELAAEYRSYTENGKKVFLFFSNQNYGEPIDGIEFLTRTELLAFAVQCRHLLPPSIRKWIDLCFPE